jgi:hypothetical protein
LKKKEREGGEKKFTELTMEHLQFKTGDELVYLNAFELMNYNYGNPVNELNRVERGLDTPAFPCCQTCVTIKQWSTQQLAICNDCVNKYF